MSSLLQHALLACDAHDVAPFQQAIEQLFSSLPDHSLTIPTTLVRSSAASDHQTAASVSSPFDAYLQQLVALCGAHESTVIQELTDAQQFQDMKDIQRYELVVNGDAIIGTIGYDAVVAKIQAHIYDALASVTPANNHDDDPTLAHAITMVAKQTLNACNCTESGGCSYEILSQFVSQHSMDHVLIRPASAKAPPLEIAFDLGPSKTHRNTWSFGLRACVSAVTWYCICDANDPTHEFYEVETTYINRLAFPLHLSPLSAETLMRRDEGRVTKLPPAEATNEAWVGEMVATAQDAV